MKPALIALLVAAMSLCLLLIPHKEHRTSASPDNLWTHDGAWKQPSLSGEMLQWNRTEYGLHWAWLVHDTEVGGRSWYAKAAPQYLCIYLLASGALALGVYWVSRRMWYKIDVRTAGTKD